MLNPDDEPARAVRPCVDDRVEAAFWRAFIDYYDDPGRVDDAQADAERYAAALTDGLDLDEAAK